MKKVFFAALALFITAAVHSQDVTRFSEILKSQAVTYGQSAYITGVYNGSVADDATEEQAFQALRDKGLISPAARPEESINLQDFAYLMVKTFDIKGGLFYTLFENPRYAMKELKARGILPPEADPSFTLNGNDAMSILSNCVELVEEN